MVFYLFAFLEINKTTFYLFFLEKKTKKKFCAYLYILRRFFKNQFLKVIIVSDEGELVLELVNIINFGPEIRPIAPLKLGRVCMTRKLLCAALDRVKGIASGSALVLLVAHVTYRVKLKADLVAFD